MHQRSQRCLADNLNHSIRKVGPDGTVTTIAGTGVAGYADGPAASAQFKNPLAVCVDRAGNVFVADTGNNRIRKLGTNGVVSTLAGTGVSGYQDGAGSTAKFDFPNDLVVDAQGNLYVTEFNNHSIRKVAPDGTVRTWAGLRVAGYVDGPGAQAQFRQPDGVVVDGSGYVFVSEDGNHAIRRISPAVTWKQ